MAGHLSPQQPIAGLLRPHTQSSVFTLCWVGPFTLDDVSAIESSTGLYFFRGKCKAQRYSRIQYCGITEQNFNARFRAHHILPEIRRELEIWLGQMVDPQPVTRASLVQAEHMIIHSLDLPLNKQGRRATPTPTTIISYWYTRSGKRQPNPHFDFPSVITWDGEVWQKGNLAIWR